MDIDNTDTKRYELMKDAADKVFELMVKAAISRDISIGIGSKRSIAWMADYIKAASKAYIAAMETPSDSLY